MSYMAVAAVGMAAREDKVQVAAVTHHTGAGAGAVAAVLAVAAHTARAMYLGQVGCM
jgi:hypothetical protein